MTGFLLKNPWVISTRSRLRAKRIAPLLRMIENAFQDYGCVNIIDIGGTVNYWNIIPEDYLDAHKVTITIVNLPGTIQAEKTRVFQFIEADACELEQFDDQSFHIAHSNSVLEHVGDWDRMIQFSQELSRVSQSFFIQTPNYWFPMEPHCMTPFFHWFPRPLRVWLVLHFQLGNWPKATSIDHAMRLTSHAQLLDRVMFQSLFQDANILYERWLGLPKSLIAVKNGYKSQHSQSSSGS